LAQQEKEKAVKAFDEANNLAWTLIEKLRTEKVNKLIENIDKMGGIINSRFLNKNDDITNNIEHRNGTLSFMGDIITSIKAEANEFSSLSDLEIRVKAANEKADLAVKKLQLADLHERQCKEEYESEVVLDAKSRNVHTKLQLDEKEGKDGQRLNLNSALRGNHFTENQTGSSLEEPFQAEGVGMTSSLTQSELLDSDGAYPSISSNLTGNSHPMGDSMDSLQLRKYMNEVIKF